MKWTEIIKNEDEYYIDLGPRDASFKIKSDGKDLDVESFKLKVFSKTDSDRGIYREEVSRIEGTVEFMKYTEEGEYADSGYVKEEFKIDGDDESLSIVYEIKKQSIEDEFIVEMEIDGADFLFNYDGKSLSPEQINIDFVMQERLQ